MIVVQEFRWGGVGGEDRAVVKAMVGLRAGKKPRQIAVDIYGADEVKANWYPDGGMRSQVRRWIDKAQRPGGRRLARPGLRATGPNIDRDSANVIQVQPGEFRQATAYKKTTNSPQCWGRGPARTSPSLSPIVHRRRREQARRKPLRDP